MIRAAVVGVGRMGLVGPLTSLAFLAAGCVAHDPVGRPPTPEAIARINEFARLNGPLRVEYIAPCPIAGACGPPGVPTTGGALRLDPVRIEAIDDRQIKFLTAAGTEMTEQAPLVAGVSASDRGRGTAVGLVVGAAVGLFLTPAIYKAVSDSTSSTNQQDQDSCKACAFGLAIIAASTSALVMAGLGYLIGGRRVFQFRAPPPVFPPPSESEP